MRVLLLGHRKMDTLLYDISTPAKRSAAYLAMFKEFDDSQFYHDLEVGVMSDEQFALGNSPRRIKMRELYRLAKAGNAEAAIALLTLRKQQSYEYEDGWDEHDVENPLPEKAKPRRTRGAGRGLLRDAAAKR